MKEPGFGWWVIPVLFVAMSITVIIIWSAPDRPIVVIALSIAMAFALIGYYVRKPKAESARAG